MTTCPHCGKLAVDAFEYDEQLGDSQSVCMNCGMVLSTGRYTSNENPWIPQSSATEFRQYNSLPSAYVEINKTETRPSRGFLSTVKRLRCFSSVVGMNSEMLKGAESLFESVFHHSDFKHALLSKKAVMAGVCIYIICRQYDWPVSLNYICHTVGCPLGEFVSVKQKIMSHFNITITSLSIEEHIRASCQSKGFSEDNLTTIEQIIQLCKKVWLVDGRRPEPLVAVAAYLTWKADDCMPRINTTFKQFCSKFGFTCGGKGSANQRLSEITRVIVLLGQEIPWLTPSMMSVKTVPLHLKDILKYQNSLLHTAIEKLDGKSAADEESEDECRLTSASIGVKCEVDAAPENSDNIGDSVTKQKCLKRSILSIDSSLPSYDDLSDTAHKRSKVDNYDN